MRRRFGPALFTLTLGALPALAEPASPGGVAVFTLAHDLYRTGLDRKDALSILAAARLLATVQLQQGSDLQKTGGTSGPENPALPPDAQAMLASALAFAEGDDLLLTALERAQTEVRYSTPVTVISRTSALAAGETEVWQVPFFGGTPSELAITGNSLSNLDVTVTDASGQTLCVELSLQDRMSCGFVMAENGLVQVTVRNSGDQANAYYLLTN